MANLTTTADLHAATLRNAGELETTASAYYTRTIELLNRVQNEIASGESPFAPDMAEPFPWAKAQTPGVLALLPAYETGTVSLTNGSASGTFSDAPSASLGSLASRLLKIPGRSDFYRISAHTAGATAFTLDQTYLDATGAALEFSAHKLDYPLVSGVLRLIEPMRTFRAQSYEGDGEGKILGMSSDKLSQGYPLHYLTSGVPTKFAIVGETGGVVTVRFNKSPDEAMRVEYDYVPTPTALTVSPDTTPIVPYKSRSVMVNAATYYLMLDKNDARADTYYRMAQAGLQAMMLARRKELAQMSKNFAKMLARGEEVGQQRLRTESGLEF